MPSAYASSFLPCCLQDCFAEFLNAEVVLATIRDIGQAVDWLRTTFLYTRVSGREGSASWV